MCSICLESINTKFKNSCNHIFCRECIIKWYLFSKNKSCPLCRIKLDSPLTEINKKLLLCKKHSTLYKIGINNITNYSINHPLFSNKNLDKFLLDKEKKEILKLLGYNFIIDITNFLPEFINIKFIILVTQFNNIYIGIKSNYNSNFKLNNCLEISRESGYVNSYKCPKCFILSKQIFIYPHLPFPMHFYAIY